MTITRGSGTKEDPWSLLTPPGTSEDSMYRDEASDPPSLVCQVGGTQLRYHLRAIDDIHAMLRAHGDWMAHGTKVLALFARDLVLFSRYFSDADVERVSPWLCCPIDGIVMKRLRALGENLGVGQINQMASARSFWDIQDRLQAAAGTIGVPRVWFDDNWGDRDRDGD